MAQLQPALKATLVSDFVQQTVKTCCEGSLKQLGINALLSGETLLLLFISRKTTTLFAGKIRWNFLRLIKSKRQKSQGFLVHTKYSCPVQDGASHLLLSGQKTISRLTSNVSGRSLLLSLTLK